ncbi:PP2C family protein-serine/threonine phosphatase [Streptomyces sp. NPDC002769]|uniref:PP2C family protein-serine/threonine phosphatase n=1 Tax=Streptomyces sp. NPDC002769 TaxID=3154542 RepID=UPI00332C9109
MAVQDDAPPPRAMTSLMGEARRPDVTQRYGGLEAAAVGSILSRVASLAAALFDAPLATVAVAGTDGAWFRTTHGPDPVADSGCAPELWTRTLLPDSSGTAGDTSTGARTVIGRPIHGELGIRFCVAAPVVTAGGERLGSIQVLDTRPRKATDRQMSALEDLSTLLVDELELRLSVSGTVATERRMRRDAERLARTLQRTLLPPALPEVPGLGVAASYHNASPDEVGGDFYDLFPLNDGRWGFFLGDVCGKGAEAAALTSLARYTLRAAAIYDPDPCGVLANLDTVLKGEYQGDDPRYCTAVFGVLQREADGSFAVTLAGGGHPPALALRADGAVHPISTKGGHLIGLLPDPHFVTATLRLAAGETLLLYTDGLTEARTETRAMLGEAGLVAHLSAIRPRGSGALLTAIDELLGGLGAGVTDDTALLALSVPPPRNEPTAQELQ